VNARELESVGQLLERRRIRMHGCAATAVASALAGVAIAPFTFRYALALLLGAAVAAALANANRLIRHDAIARLALDPSAYDLAEVRRHGSRLIRPAERQRLAEWLHEIVREAHIPGNWYLADRVSLHATQLESLAREIVAPRVNVGPVAMALCRRLLSHAVESPLYNPEVPAEELIATIQRIRRGITVRVGHPTVPPAAGECRQSALGEGAEGRALPRKGEGARPVLDAQARPERVVYADPDRR
jgi:hypothetical protein